MLVYLKRAKTSEKIKKEKDKRGKKIKEPKR
jgi:hypothetical protein